MFEAVFQVALKLFYGHATAVRVVHLRVFLLSYFVVEVKISWQISVAEAPPLETEKVQRVQVIGIEEVIEQDVSARMKKPAWIAAFIGMIVSAIIPYLTVRN